MVLASEFSDDSDDDVDGVSGRVKGARKPSPPRTPCEEPSEPLSPAARWTPPGPGSSPVDTSSSPGFFLDKGTRRSTGSEGKPPPEVVLNELGAMDGGDHPEATPGYAAVESPGEVRVSLKGCETGREGDSLVGVSKEGERGHARGGVIDAVDRRSAGLSKEPHDGGINSSQDRPVVSKKAKRRKRTKKAGGDEESGDGGRSSPHVGATPGKPGGVGRGAVELGQGVQGVGGEQGGRRGDDGDRSMATTPRDVTGPDMDDGVILPVKSKKGDRTPSQRLKPKGQHEDEKALRSPPPARNGFSRAPDHGGVVSGLREAGNPTSTPRVGSKRSAADGGSTRGGKKRKKSKGSRKGEAGSGGDAIDDIFGSLG